MAIINGSLGPLLQGVSQQDARVRLDGQVTEQINLVSDVTKGLSTRPASVEIGLLEGTSDLTGFADIVFQDTGYIIGYGRELLRMWKLDGTSVPVNINGHKDYLGVDMRFHVVDDKIVAVNRLRVVRSLPANPRPNRNLGVFFLKGGEFSRQYVIQVQFVGAGPGGSVLSISASYTTPDGNDEGDGEKSQSIYIAQQLRAALVSHADWPTDTQISRYHDAVAINHPNYRIRLNTGDGTGGSTLMATTDTVKTVSDLSVYAPHGMLV